jgi:hypothetical protein
MTQKAVVILEVEKNDRKYEFMMPIGSPYGEAYDVCFEFLQEITKMSKEAADRVSREELEIKTDDDIKEEVIEEA